MDRIALRRHGRPDLVFEGFLVAHIRESTAMAGDVDLAIYRTRSGKLILASTAWAGEAGDRDGLCKALSFACADDMCLFLEEQGAFVDVNACLLRRAAQSDIAFRDVMAPAVTA